MLLSSVLHPTLFTIAINCYTTAAIEAAKRAAIPAFLEVNSPLALERVEFATHKLVFRELAKRYEVAILNRADHVFAVSTTLKQYLEQDRNVPPKKISLLPNGADPVKFHPDVDGSAVRHKYQLTGQTVIGFVGILRPWHGLDLLLDSFTRLVPDRPNLRLMIVGDGPMSDDLVHMTRQLGIHQQIVFTGRVSHGNIPAYLAAVDICVSPKATFYACPMKILEYLAMGIPTVAPRMPNICDVLNDDIDALLFEPDNVNSLTSALETLIHRPELARRIGQAGREAVEARFNWDENAKIVVEHAQAYLAKCTS